MDRGPKCIILQRHVNDKQEYEKMFNITNQGNANKTTMHYHLILISDIKKAKVNKCRWECGGKGTLV